MRFFKKNIDERRADWLVFLVFVYFSARYVGVKMPIVGPIASICGYGGNYAIFIKNSGKFGIIKSKRVLTNEKIYDIIE